MTCVSVNATGLEAKWTFEEAKRAKGREVREDKKGADMSKADGRWVTLR